MALGGGSRDFGGILAGEALIGVERPSGNPGYQQKIILRDNLKISREWRSGPWVAVFGLLKEISKPAAVLLFPDRELVYYAAIDNKIWHESAFKRRFDLDGIYPNARRVAELLSWKQGYAGKVWTDTTPTDIFYPCVDITDIRKDGAARNCVDELCWQMAHIVKRELEIQHVPPELVACNFVLYDWGI
jgi:hypothetical protein